MNIELHTKQMGSGPPLIILHGLFGTWENWGAQAKKFSNSYTVYAMDARNHGKSPRTLVMGYTLMAADVLCTMDKYNIKKASIIGHSMGGKTAMQLAMNHPERVARLIVVDIAPKDYPSSHDAIFSSLMSINLHELTSRSAADIHLGKTIDSKDIRTFLLKNLYRDKDRFLWKFNLHTLSDQYAVITKGLSGSLTYDGPTLFIKGALSNYIQKSDEDIIKRYFPKPRVKVIAGAGHWPHAEKSAVFYKIANDFLNG